MATYESQLNKSSVVQQTESQSVQLPSSKLHNRRLLRPLGVKMGGFEREEPDVA